MQTYSDYAFWENILTFSIFII